MENNCEPRVLRLIHKNHFYTGFSKNQRAYTLSYKKVVNKKVLRSTKALQKLFNKSKNQESFKKVLVVEFTENFKKA